MSDKFYVGLDLTGLENNGKSKPVSRVTLLLDDENALTAGDDTGMEITAPCPHATQAMVDALLAQIKGHQYQMYEADDANIDPAAELGDGLTAGGLYSVISCIDDDGSGYASLSAPGNEELEDEYPSAGPMTLEFNRKIGETRSLISKTAESILLKVEGVEGNLSSIEQYVDSITMEVTNGDTFSSIVLKAGDATITSQTIYMKGLVTFTGLSSGTTTIDGACIKTGLIDADRLNLTGAITFGDLSTSVRNDINDAYTMAEDAQAAVGDISDTVGGWTYRGTTYIDGAMLMTGTVMASDLLGGTVGLLDRDETRVGGIIITDTLSGDGLEFYTDSGGIRINAAGDFWVDARYGSLGVTRSGVVCEADCVPQSDDYYALGAAGLYWSDIYCRNDVIHTSDSRLKHGIKYGLEDYDAFFDALRPLSYLYNQGTSGRRHAGLCSQDVEAALVASGLTGMDFAGFIKTPLEDGSFEYALRYGEFIAMLIDQTQKLKARVGELERRLSQ